jgi:hypothetical protein
MIWHERSPKQQQHPRLWLPQVQRPLSLIVERNLGPSASYPYSTECVEGKFSDVKVQDRE